MRVLRSLFGLCCLAALLVAPAAAQTQNTPTRIEGGGGAVKVEVGGGVTVAPKDGTGVTVTASCTGAPVAPAGKMRFCVDYLSSVVRLSINGGAYVNWTAPGAGFGTVQSVGLSAPAALFSVSGSPVTNTGTLGLSLVSQAANKVLASPDGSAGPPSIRSLVLNDLPSIPFSKVTGTLPQTQGGTGLTSYAFGDMIYADNTATLARLPGNTSGTRKFLRQTGNGVISGAPAWDVLAGGDIPPTNLAAGNVNGGVTGTLPRGNGGLGLSVNGAANQLLGESATPGILEFKTLNAGANVSISHSAGGITIATSGTLAASASSLFDTDTRVNRGQANSWRVVGNTPTTAQTLYVYGTADTNAAGTAPTNYVRAQLGATATAVNLAAESGGTGAANVDINLTPAGTGNVRLGATTRLLFGTGGNGFGYVDTVGPTFYDANNGGRLAFNVQSLSTNRTATWPDAAGTVVLDSNTQTVTGKTLRGPDGTASAPTYSFANETNSGWYRGGASDFRFSLAGTDVARFASGLWGIGPNSLTFGAAIGSPDVYVLRDGAANALAQRNGASAQTFRLYNTYTDASNYERLFFRFSSGQAEVGTEGAGTGSNTRNLTLQAGNFIYFKTNGSNRWAVESGGHLTPQVDNAYDIGASGAKPRNLYLGGKVASYNGVTTAGLGAAVVVYDGRTANTCANIGSTTLYTTPAATEGSYVLHAQVEATGNNSDTATLNASYTTVAAISATKAVTNVQLTTGSFNAGSLYFKTSANTTISYSVTGSTGGCYIASITLVRLN